MHVFEDNRQVTHNAEETIVAADIDSLPLSKGNEQRFIHPHFVAPFHYQAVVVIGSARRFFSKPFATPIRGFTSGDRITFARRRSLASPTRPAVLSSPHKVFSTYFCACRVRQGKHPRFWYSRYICSYPTEDGAEMSFHAVPGHQPHLTLRGVTFSAGSRASRPRVAVAHAPLPQPTAGRPPAFPLDLLPAGRLRNPAPRGVPFFRWRESSFYLCITHPLLSGGIIRS